jgi:polyhydroxybutyrate depolymerase
MKKLIIAFLGVFILLSVTFIFGQRAWRNRVPKHLVKKTIEVDGLERDYYVFIPKNLKKEEKVPLVFVFHGGGGTAVRMDKFTNFSELAEKEKFVVVYPQGVQNHWNDGREVNAIEENGKYVDDLAFVKAMLDEVGKDHNIDQKRIFSTGLSNGGFFSNYLAVNLSEKFAAIAPVIGGISKPLSENFNPKKSISVFIIQGTEDKLVPYNGGTVAGNRGEFISTDDAVSLWTNHNKTSKNSTKGNLPDTDKKDGCTVETFLWTKGKNNTEVKLFKLNGGGHTWAGGSQYLPKLIVGNVCRDFDATEVIWEFFKNHPKQ